MSHARKHKLHLVPRARSSRGRRNTVETRRNYEDGIARATIQFRLDRLKGPKLRVQLVRATLGEVYDHARRGETLITCNRQHPQILTLDELRNLTGVKTTSSDIMWSYIRKAARRYSYSRKIVIHPWQHRKKK